MALAKIMAYLGLNKSEFDKGMASVPKQIDSAAGSLKSISRGINFAILAQGIKRIAGAVKDYLDDVRTSHDYSIVSEEDIDRIDRYGATVDRAKKNVLGFLASLGAKAAGGVEQFFGTLGAMSGDSSLSWSEATKVSAQVSDESQKQFESQRKAAEEAEKKAKAEKDAAAAAKENARAQEKAADEAERAAEAAAKETRERQEKEGEQRLELAAKRGAKYAELALNRTARKEAAQEQRKMRRDQRKLDTLADEAEASMGRGVGFGKLGRNKQLALLARQESQQSANWDAMPENIKGIADAVSKIATQLGIQ